MTFAAALNCLRAELRDMLARPHKLQLLRDVLKLSTLLNELEAAHERELAAADRELLIERRVADVIPLFARHDVE